MRLTLPLLLLGLTTSASAHTMLQQPQRPWREDTKNRPREYKAPHRKLQRTAAICADYPETFTTSLYVNHVGDGTPFAKADLDVLLQMALVSFNQMSAATCDYTYRTLSSVTVSGVYYSEELGFVRLRYDLTGACDGCVPKDPESGIGPLFGGYENNNERRRQTAQQQQVEQPSKRNRRIKGLSSNHKKRKLDLDDEPRPTSRKKNNYSICDCETEISSSRQRGPTPSEFGVAFNGMIEAARKDGRMSGVSHVEDVFEAGVAGTSTVLPTGEAREETCANQQDFTTDVWVEFEMGRDLTNAEKLPMEVALLETFNEMNLMSCDVQHFRRVNDVTYVETRASQDKLQMKFAVKGKCVNCDPNNVNLFEPNPPLQQDPPNVVIYRAPTRTMLMAEIARLERVQAQPFMVYRDIPTSCVCPLNQDGLPLRSPTTAEFAQILQTSIDTLRAENKLTSVSQIVRVEENEMDATCSSEVTEFVSTVFADFEGDPELLQPSEIQTLEGGFQQTYNDLIYASCDQYFRNITEVRLIPGVARRRRQRSLQATNVGNAANSSDVPDLQSEAPSVYMVAGECRGCPVSRGGTFQLYDDAFRRFRKLMVGGKEETIACYTYGAALNGLPDIRELTLEAGSGDVLTRVRQEERRLEQCLCAPGTIPDAARGPSTEDFRTDYNVKIVDYNEQGTVRNVQEVAKLVEVPPGFVDVDFSIFYGTLGRLGNPTEADYEPLLKQTNAFFRRRLIAHYAPIKDVTLNAVTLVRGETTRRTDLDMLQVDYTAELIFNDEGPLPTPTQIANVMAGFDYVDYITDYVWALNSIPTSVGPPGGLPGTTPNGPANGPPSAFRLAHSIRFAPRQSTMVDLRMQFTVRADRTNQAPNSDDRQGLSQQMDQFFLQHLRDSGLFAVSFTSHIDAQDVAITGAGEVLVDFDATIEFPAESDTPSETELLAVLQGADLSGLQTKLATAPRTGTAAFSDPFDIVFAP